MAGKFATAWSKRAWDKRNRNAEGHAASLGIEPAPKHFVVIVEYGSLNKHAFGIFRSFMKADRAARAIPPRIGNRDVTVAYVLPIEPVGDLP